MRQRKGFDEEIWNLLECLSKKRTRWKVSKSHLLSNKILAVAFSRNFTIKHISTDNMLTLHLLFLLNIFFFTCSIYPNVVKISGFVKEPRKKEILRLFLKRELEFFL
jgi:hypothetical protein